MLACLWKVRGKGGRKKGLKEGGREGRKEGGGRVGREGGPGGCPDSGVEEVRVRLEERGAVTHI